MKTLIGIDSINSVNPHDPAISELISYPVVKQPERNDEYPHENSPGKTGMLFSFLVRRGHLLGSRSLRSVARLGISGAAKTKAVVFHLWVEKTAVERRCAEPASVRQTVEPGTPFQHALVFAIFRFRNRVAGVRQVIGVHPFPDVP